MEIALSSGGAFAYLEYAWLTALNTAAQAITANTLTTCTLDSEIRDAGGHGSISANQVTLAAGTYYAKALVPVYCVSGMNDMMFRLYDVTNSIALTGRHRCLSGASSSTLDVEIETQFVIAGSTVVRLEVEFSSNGVIGLGAAPLLTSATAGKSQRTTLQLWKLA